MTNLQTFQNDDPTVFTRIKLLQNCSFAMKSRQFDKNRMNWHAVLL